MKPLFMKIALIQTSLVWENPEVNRNYFESKITALTEKVDLIILPEMFTTGFTMHPEAVAETMDGVTVNWLKSIAVSGSFAITGSIVIKEEGNYYNRLLFVFPDGKVEYYDKKHLFTLAGEEKVYKAGNQRLLVHYLGYKICPLVCYDLRFPVWARNTEDYDLLIYVANWPQVRVKAWDALLQARAIENVCYVVGVNRIGNDIHDYFHSGHSQVIDYLGEYLVAPSEKEGIFITTIDRSKMLQIREKTSFLKDKDTFNLS